MRMRLNEIEMENEEQQQVKRILSSMENERINPRRAELRYTGEPCAQHTKDGSGAFFALEQIKKAMECLQCEHNDLFGMIDPILLSDNPQPCEKEQSGKCMVELHSQLVSILIQIENDIYRMAGDVQRVRSRINL